MRELVIATSDGEKGRSFRAALLAYSTSKSLWSGGDSDHIRPIWAMLATTAAESLPFVRNLQSGRKAILVTDDRRSRGAKQTFECLKSADYCFAAQSHPEGVVWTVYLPDLFRIDPGVLDPDGVRFCFIPREDWLSAPNEALAHELLARYQVDKGTWESEWTRKARVERLDLLRYVTRVATVFCAAYLDTRTRCPLIPDPRFYALVLAALLDSGAVCLAHEHRYGDGEWGKRGFDYQEVDLSDVGLMPGLACNTTHVHLEPVLAECVRSYEGGLGSIKVAA